MERKRGARCTHVEREAVCCLKVVSLRVRRAVNLPCSARLVEVDVEDRVLEPAGVTDDGDCREKGEEGEGGWEE